MPLLLGFACVHRQTLYNCSAYVSGCPGRNEACSLLSVMTEQLHRESQYLDKKGVLGMKYPLLKAGALSNPGYSRQLFAAQPVFRFGDVVRLHVLGISHKTR